MDENNRAILNKHVNWKEPASDEDIKATLRYTIVQYGTYMRSVGVHDEFSRGLSATIDGLVREIQRRG